MCNKTPKLESCSKFWSKSSVLQMQVSGGPHLHLHLHLPTFHTAPSVPRSQVFNDLKDVSRDIFTVKGNFLASSSSDPF
jgi:hypothetical protein